MKALDWRRDQDLLSSSLPALEGALVHMLISGRNAWHSTWITRYRKNIAFYSSLPAAKAQAEVLRRQGSVFYIRQVPVLMMRTTHGAVIQAEFHSRTCFGKWNTAAGGDLLRIGTPVSLLLAGLGPDSALWRPPKISQYSFVTVVPEWDDIPALFKVGSFKNWTSQSVGPKYQLHWTEGRQDYRRTGINSILRSFEAVNPLESRTEALSHYRDGQSQRTKERADSWRALAAGFDAALNQLENSPGS